MTDDRTLTMVREFDAPPAAVFGAWTDPALIPKWFAPAPVTTPKVEVDLRVGGSNLIVMRLADGTEMPTRGVYLEVVPGKRLVVTDAFVEAWVPSEKPFITIIIDLEDLPAGRTRATYTVRHWSAEDRRMHEEMGFEAGWGQCADQLNALLKTL